MDLRAKKHGISLTEMVIVVAGVALLAYLAVPASRALMRSFDSPESARPLISGALASARAIAAREHRYAGIRFQKVFDLENPIEAPQYMIFIVHDPEIPPSAQGNLGCRAVDGLEPIRLPDSVGVMDLSEVAGDVDFEVAGAFENATTFSILFSPSGKLVRHTSKVQSVNTNDMLFNTAYSIVGPRQIGMFVEDQDGASPQPFDELSRASFIIYDSRRFEQAYRQGRAYSGYLKKLIDDETIYINPYTGTMISGD